MAAGWLRTGGLVTYYVSTRSPEKIRARLKKLGVDVEALENRGFLRINDWYSYTIGRKSKERYTPGESLKVSDLSLDIAKWIAGQQPEGSPLSPNLLRISDNYSCLARFNDEKSWVEYSLTRPIPSASSTQTSGIMGLVSGLHSNWVYKNLETAVDGVVDFRLIEKGQGTKTIMRIRSMRDVGFDPCWHEISIGENFEVTLER
jgi:KaiC/GvpD/RAD55 family RecA-like ATPase